MERSGVVRAAFIVFTALSIAVLGSACASEVTIVPGEPAGSLDHAQRKEIDAFVESALERYDVPGVAIAVIKDGQVAYQAGFGVRDKDDGRPMTTSTLFALASLSKPMTTTMMASLADDGLLDWDQPVHEIIPSFALSHPEWAQQVRLRHLVGLSSGVPENNTLLFLERLTPTQMIASLPEIPSVAPPGELYGYSNHAFSTGGYAAAVLAGASYEDASLSETYARTMRERVFDPIGMPSATLDFDAAAADENHATPHRYEPWSGVVQSMPLEPERFEMQVAPGGGIRADVADVAKFALSQFDGPARVVSEGSLAELHDGVVEMEPGAHYALGWEVWDDYLGLKTLRHTGNSLGFTTSLRIAQSEGLGVVVLVNEGFVDPFVAAIDRFVMELLLDRPHADDAEDLAALSEQRTWQREFVAQTTPADQAGAEPFLGRYSHATSVTFVDAGLQLETKNGPYPLLSTSTPGTLALGGVLSSLLVVERDDAAGGASSLTFGRPISDPLTWPATLERLGD